MYYYYVDPTVGFVCQPVEAETFGKKSFGRNCVQFLLQHWTLHWSTF